MTRLSTTPRIANPTTYVKYLLRAVHPCNHCGEYAIWLNFAHRYLRPSGRFIWRCDNCRATFPVSQSEFDPGRRGWRHLALYYEAEKNGTAST